MSAIVGDEREEEPLTWQIPQKMAFFDQITPFKLPESA